MTDSLDGNDRADKRKASSASNGSKPTTRSDILNKLSDNRIQQTELGSSADSTAPRRSYLKVIGSALGLSFLPNFVSARKSSRKIPAAVLSNGDVRYKEVSEEWFEHYSQAMEGLEELSGQLRNEDWASSLGLRRNDQILVNYKDIDFYKFTLYVYVTDKNDAYNNVGGEINGITIEIKDEVDETDDSDHCGTCSDDQGDECFDCLPGGAALERGTLGCEVNILGESASRAITAAHVFSPYCDSVDGENVYHYCKDSNGTISKDYIGEVSQSSIDHDIAFIEDEDGNDIQGIDDTIRGSLYNLSGHVTKANVCNHISAGIHSHNWGKNSCYTVGELLELTEEWNTSSACDSSQLENETYWIKTEAYAESGDSGGPHWYEDDGESESLLYGIHKSSNRVDDDDCDTFNYSRMSAAFDIHENAGTGDVYFGTSSTC